MSLLLAGLSVALAPSASAITVSSELSATALRATDTLVLRVSARWDDGEEQYRFVTPRPVENPFLRLTGQSAGGGQRLEAGIFASEKSWYFTFVCVRSGTTQVVPPAVTYTNTESGQTDSAAGSPMPLSISPAPEPPFDFSRLLPYALGLVVAAGAAVVGARIVRRRRQAVEERKLHRTPEEEALELLEALRTLKREDRGEQFYSDLEKIVLGLWEARVKKRLAGKTPGEVAQILRESSVSEDECAQVHEALTQCHNVRFGGGRAEYEMMDKSLHTVRGWLKPAEGS